MIRVGSDDLLCSHHDPHGRYHYLIRYDSTTHLVRMAKRMWPNTQVNVPFTAQDKQQFYVGKGLEKMSLSGSEVRI